MGFQPRRELQRYAEKGDIKIVTTPTNDMRSYHVNSDKVKRVLGFEPNRSIEDAAILYTELRKDISLEEAFIAFENRRLKRTQYIISQSRKIGSLAQIGNPLVAGLRNAALRLAPASLREKQFEKLYNVTF